MPLFRSKPIVIEAHQWHRNGDHPDDFSDRMQPEHHTCEGMVVRYFRHPDVPGERECKHCARKMHDHGWIDTLEGGHIVCPGDWIITGTKGERYPCKPDIFATRYEPATPAEPVCESFDTTWRSAEEEVARWPQWKLDGAATSAVCAECKSPLVELNPADDTELWCRDCREYRRRKAPSEVG